MQENNEYSLLPFEFKRFGNNFVLLVNETGDYLKLTQENFRCLCNKKIEDLPKDISYKLESRHFISKVNNLDLSLELLANKYRSKREYLYTSTSLHMLVVTLRCNHKCEYCQVSSVEDDAYKYDMSLDVARKSVEMALQSPSNDIKIEFQGGDALLNFNTVVGAVEYAEELNAKYKKNLEFVICTNLYALTNEHIEFLKKHKIYVSTSLDGPKEIHNKYRCLRECGSSYDVFIKNLNRVRMSLGEDSVNALMTTTSNSLENIESIIDEYVRLGFTNIFFRALNPYGDAYKNNLYYTPEEFVQMYKRGLEYILELNKKGVVFSEYLTSLLLRRITSVFSTGFVDLQSPTGAGISGVIYDYNGDVYPADEARMLARMGNPCFKMGNVFDNTYKEVFLSPILKKLVEDSCVETIPNCSRCAYRTYCGVDVFRNYLETGDVSNVSATSFFCRKQSLIFDYLFEKLEDPEFCEITSTWI